LGEVGGRQAADEELRKFAGSQRIEVGAAVVDESEADLVRHDLAVQQPDLASQLTRRVPQPRPRA
jgi:hypothetical protein